MLIGLSAVLTLSSVGLMVYAQSSGRVTCPTEIGCNAMTANACNSKDGCFWDGGCCVKGDLDGPVSFAIPCSGQISPINNKCPVGCYVEGDQCLSYCTYPKPENATLFYGDTKPSSSIFSSKWWHSSDLDGSDKDVVSIAGNELGCAFGCKKGYQYSGTTQSCEKLPEVETQCFFCQFFVERIGNILTADTRDDIMKKLDTVFQFNWDNVTVVQETIPSWAIMAFNLTKCPEWWTRFGEADNRFLMWAQSGFGGIWWKSTIKLEANQLPAHQHIYEDTIWSENSSRIINNEPYFKFDTGDAYGDVIIWQNGGNTDRNNYPTIWYRATWPNIYTWKNKDKFLPLNNYSWGSLSQSDINILNPYVKVLYCVKN